MIPTLSNRRSNLRWVRALLAGSLLTLWVGVPPRAGQPAPAADEEGFTPLFDGATLAGWHKNPRPIGHGTGGLWLVEDGAITGEQDPPGSGNGGILLSDRQFGDFELRIELKPDWGPDSGLFLRSNERGQCYQMMVDYHDAGNVGHIYGEGIGGFNNRPFEIDGRYDDAGQLVGLKSRPSGLTVPPAYSCTGQEFVEAWRVNDWNEARIRVVGNPPRITTWINGLKVSEFDGATYEGPNYHRGSVLETLGPEGHIALQVHGGGSLAGKKCRWRNIRVKPL